MNRKLRRSAVRAAEIALIALATWAGSLAWAQSSTTPAANPPPPPGANGQEPPRHGPPPEALAACKNLASGAACSFTSPRGAERGSCFAPEGKPLACRPARPPGEGKPGQAEAPPRPKTAN